MFVRGILLQFGLYLFVGGLSCLGDLGSFVLLMGMGITILWASALSFVVGVVINYFLSTRLVFRAGRFGRLIEVGSFLAVALVGLGLTITLMYMLTVWARFAGVAAKLIAAPIVVVWNFLGRRFLVFHPDMPAEMVALSARIAAGLGRAVPTSDEQN